MSCPCCGDGEIRTRDTVSRIHTFQACSFNHSDTSPFFEECKNTVSKSMCRIIFDPNNRTAWRISISTLKSSTHTSAGFSIFLAPTLFLKLRYGMHKFQNIPSATAFFLKYTCSIRHYACLSFGLNLWFDRYRKNYLSGYGLCKQKTFENKGIQ